MRTITNNSFTLLNRVMGNISNTQMNVKNPEENSLPSGHHSQTIFNGATMIRDGPILILYAI